MDLGGAPDLKLEDGSNDGEEDEALAELASFACFEAAPAPLERGLAPPFFLVFCC